MFWHMGLVYEQQLVTRVSLSPVWVDGWGSREPHPEAFPGQLCRQEAAA